MDREAGTVRPAEGHPAIVTGCAGISCPVTLEPGVRDCSRAARDRSASARRERYTALVRSHSAVALVKYRAPIERATKRRPAGHSR